MSSDESSRERAFSIDSTLTHSRLARRFGIDKTDPSFKQTEGMKAVLKAQQENRRKKRKGEVKDVVGKDGEGGGEGAMNLSALVANMKRKKAKS